ncbi:Berardinelli-Seip congenital lipodystrophy 2 (seipin) [Allomyces arbusculus]|nr:Berardinelli-Seip congenital lipodystrophy 2 (seipin) [Allomyces arbusculus]
MIREATLFVFSPLLSLVEPHYQSLHAFVAAPKTHRFVLKSLVFAALFALLFIGAVLAYAAFYTFYVPQVGFVQDVPLRYVPTNPSDPRSPLVPSGHVVLDAPGLPTSLLSPGQPYDLTLVLRVPNSPHNYAQGTFTAAVTLTNGDGVLAKGANANPTPLYYAAKPVALRWTSPLLAWMDTLAFAFPLVLGYASEQQTVNVRLIEGVVSPAPLPPVLPGIDRDLAGAVEPATGASALWNMAATVAGSVVGADAANSAKDGENAAVVAPADTPIPAASMKAYATMLAQWRFQHAAQATSPASPLAVPPPPLRSTFYPLPSDTEAEPAPVVPSRALAQAHVALSAPVHVYAATLRVDAQFYGLRYLMYYWFFTSASIGVGILMVWEVIIGLAVWRVVIGKKITVEVIDEEDEEEEEDDSEEELEGSDVGTDEGSVTGDDESGSELASLEGSGSEGSGSEGQSGSDDDDRSSTSSSSSSSSSGAESESDHEDQAAQRHRHHHRRHHHHRRGLDHGADEDVEVPTPAPAPAAASPNPAPTPARRRTDEEDATILASRANTAARATATGVSAARGTAELRQRRAPPQAGSADLLAETSAGTAGPSGAPGSASSGEESVVKVEKRDAEGA